MEVQLLVSRCFAQRGDAREFLAPGQVVLVSPPRGVLGTLCRWWQAWKRLAGFSATRYPDAVGVELGLISMSYTPVEHGSSVDIDGARHLSVRAADMAERLEVIKPHDWDWIKDAPCHGAQRLIVASAAGTAWETGIVGLTEGLYPVAWIENIPTAQEVARWLELYVPQRKRPAPATWLTDGARGGKVVSLPVNVHAQTSINEAAPPTRAWWQSLYMRAEAGMYVRLSPATAEIDPWESW